MDEIANGIGGLLIDLLLVEPSLLRYDRGVHIKAIRVS